MLYSECLHVESHSTFLIPLGQRKIYKRGLRKHSSVICLPKNHPNFLLRVTCWSVINLIQYTKAYSLHFISATLTYLVNIRHVCFERYNAWKNYGTTVNCIQYLQLLLFLSNNAKRFKKENILVKQIIDVKCRRIFLFRFYVFSR